jgi:hypothetical protein
VLAGVELAYQNLESVELGVTTVDHYFDNLGGISRASPGPRGPRLRAMPVYIGDQTKGDGTVRSLGEQVALETRTRMLNPKWYEGMLEHGYEGVRQIEAHVTNTMGWSATTGQVAPWVYREITQTFVLDPAMRERLAWPQPQGLGQGREPAPRSLRAAVLGAGCRRRSRRCATVKIWKIGSRASCPSRPAPPLEQMRSATVDRQGDGRVSTLTLDMPRHKLHPTARSGRTARAACRSSSTPTSRSRGPRSSPSTARAASARARPPPTSRSPSPSSASASCRSAAIPSTIRPSRSPRS